MQLCISVVVDQAKLSSRYTPPAVLSFHSRYTHRHCAHISGWLTMHRCGHDSALVNRKVPLGGRPFWCCNGSRMVPVCGSWPGEAGVSKAAAHRSLDEALVIVARRAISNIAHVLDRHQRSGELVVYLDGKSMGTDWGAARTESGKHLWYFGGARPSTAKCGS